MLGKEYEIDSDFWKGKMNYFGCFGYTRAKFSIPATMKTTGMDYREIVSKSYTNEQPMYYFPGANNLSLLISSLIGTVFIKLMKKTKNEP